MWMGEQATERGIGNGMSLLIFASIAAAMPGEGKSILDNPQFVALRDRRMLSADGIFIIVATISEEDGSSVVPPEVIARGVPFLEGDNQFTEDLREAVEDSLDRAAEQRITEIDVLESFLHDDLAQFIYQRLKRRPMLLPVVVEV